MSRRLPVPPPQQSVMSLCRRHFRESYRDGLEERRDYGRDFPSPSRHSQKKRRVATDFFLFRKQRDFSFFHLDTILTRQVVFTDCERKLRYMIACNVPALGDI